MMGHETVNGDLTGHTIYDTTNRGWRFFGIYTYIPMQDRINFIYISRRGQRLMVRLYGVPKLF